MDLKYFKDSVRKLAKEKEDFSPEDFAIKALGWSDRQGYYQFFKRKYIDEDTIEKIAEYFGVSKNILLHHEGKYTDQTSKENIINEKKEEYNLKESDVIESLREVIRSKEEVIRTKEELINSQKKTIELMENYYLNLKNKC